MRPAIASWVLAAVASGLAATARELGVKNPFDPEANIDAGTRYLATLLRFFRDERLALAAYNAGPSWVRKLGRVPSFPETKAYVRQVLRWKAAYARGE